MSDEFSDFPSEFRTCLKAAERNVEEARAVGDKKRLALALKELGNIERRPAVFYERAVGTFTEAAELFGEIGQPLEQAWCLRHIGIVREYQERLDEAERSYDEALALFRRHADENSLDYANTVRYPAVVKNRLGKREESARLWEEAHDRYKLVGPAGLPEGMAEAAAWLTIFAADKGDKPSAQHWLNQAALASTASNDPDTHKFVAEVRAKVDADYLLRM